MVYAKIANAPVRAAAQNAISQKTMEITGQDVIWQLNPQV